MMTSRERVIETINHRQPDRIPIDLGATSATGIHASALYRLRRYLGLPEHDLPTTDLLEILGEVEPDIRALVKADVVGLFKPGDNLGVPNSGGKQRFIMPDGTPVLINAGNQYDVLADGSIQMYPQGDRSARPSVKMPAGGYYFDVIDRAPPYDEDNLTPREDFKNFFSVLSDETALYYERESKRLYEETDCAILGNLSGASFGCPGFFPGAFEKEPRGIRSYEDWSMAQILYPEYIEEVCTMQTEVMLKNLEIYKEAVGDRIQMIWISGKDYGAQNGELLSAEMFRQLYKPHYKRICDWIHQNTNWKTFLHSCGSIVRLLDDFVDMGVDILNPVQLSARGMDAHMLKEKYGDKLVFWGGGVDTQDMLPNGTPEQVAAQVKERLDILAKGGGYVFNPIHNIQGDVSAENIWAAFKAVHEYNDAHAI